MIDETNEYRLKAEYESALAAFLAAAKAVNDGSDVVGVDVEALYDAISDNGVGCSSERWGWHIEHAVEMDGPVQRAEAINHEFRR